MKYLLVDPGKVSESWYENRQCPNLGLAYIGSYLQFHNQDVNILDMAAYNIDNDMLADYVLDYKPDVVGFSSASFNILDAYQGIKAVKRANKKIITVLGGAHASALPERCRKECKELDIVIVGNGETEMLNLKYIKNKGIRIRPHIRNIDDLPFPNWSMHDLKKYSKSYSYKFNQDEQILPIITARGCPFACKFCFPLHGRDIRYRHEHNIVSELIKNIDAYGVRFFYFVDSSFTIDRTNTQKLCQLIIKEKLDISWKCQSRVDLVDKETMDLMKEAGCELIFFGIESGSNDQLKRMSKGITTESIINAVSVAHQSGIHVRGSFIIGLDGDTHETINQTINFSKELKQYGLEQAQFHCLDLYPGTYYWNMVERGEGTLKRMYNTYDWSIFSRNNPHIVPGDMTIDEIEKLVKYAREQFNEN